MCTMMKMILLHQKKKLWASYKIEYIMFKNKIKLLYFKPSGFKIKWFDYYIQFAIYKKSFSRDLKWFEKIPYDCLNSVGNIYSSLFFHLFIDKVLFEIPKDWNNDDYNKFCNEIDS